MVTAFSASNAVSAYPGAGVLDHVADAVLVTDHAGHLVYANPAARSNGQADLLPPARRLGEQARLRGAPAEGAADGWWRRVTPLADGGLVVVARREWTEDSQHYAEARFAELFEHAPMDMAVLLVQADGKVIIKNANAAFCRTTGLLLGEIAGCETSAVFDPATASAIARDACISVGQGGLDCEHTLVFPAGQRQVRTHYRPMPDEIGGTSRVLLTQFDLTENRRIESALRQALRLEVVGQLTGGVAHDFNNLLTAIIGSLDLLDRAVTDERQHRWVRVATEAAQRGATLTQQLLAYARKQFLAPRATNIGAALGGMVELVQGSLGRRIVLQTRFDADTWAAHTDIAQLELALLNLMVNARAAMPQGGQVLLSTRNIAAGSPGLPAELEQGDYVLLAVADTGVGMKPEVLARAVEPFFTTKGVGEGSGLGLSQAYGFARQLGGTLRLTSRPDAGTLAEIFLPRAIG